VITAIRITFMFAIITFKPCTASTVDDAMESMQITQEQENRRKAKAVAV